MSVSLTELGSLSCGLCLYYGPSAWTRGSVRSAHRCMVRSNGRVMAVLSKATLLPWAKGQVPEPGIQGPAVWFQLGFPMAVPLCLIIRSPWWRGWLLVFLFDFRSHLVNNPCCAHPHLPHCANSFHCSGFSSTPICPGWPPRTLD